MKKRYLIGLQAVLLVITLIISIYASIFSFPMIEVLLKDVPTSEETAGAILAIVILLPIWIILASICLILCVINICLAITTIKNADGLKRTFAVINLTLSIIFVLVIILAIILFFTTFAINNKVQAG